MSGVLCGDATLTAPWGLAVRGQRAAMVVYHIRSGNCCVRLLERGELISLAAGDLILLPRFYAHTVCDTPRTPAIPLEDIQQSQPAAPDLAEEWLRFMFSGGFVYGGGGQVTAITPIRFYLETSFPELILNTLPPFIKISKLSGIHAESISLIERQLRLVGSTGFFGQVSAIRLAEALLVTILTDHFLAEIRATRHEVFDVRDTVVTKAIGSMLHDVKEDWSAARLAKMSNLSRSAFVSRFVAAVGQSPSQFLTAIRMSKASDLLLKTDQPLVKIALAVGYGSEAAFNRAFRRSVGEPPGRFRERGQ
ncbi:helix-turn-helix protein [Paraburkholderia sp. BL21I4N1]|nr:helix-turn-helix protein [Paraburkholderia sp. BL21I4N1]